MNENQIPTAWAHLPFWQAGWPALQARLAQSDWLPGPQAVFRALHLTPPEGVRVILLGQDPYPTPGDAMGLCFSVAKGRPLPRSLSNIFKEMQDDLHIRPQDGDLSHWAAQGVLMLNSSLSVAPHAAGSHARWGWSALVSQILAERRRPVAWLLWGAHAQTLATPAQGDLVVASAHPSPLSARRGFFGSRPFSRVNGWLTARGEAPIDWAGPSSRR